MIVDRSTQAAWCTALPDWQERMRAGQPLVPDLPLFEDEAAMAVRIFDRLRLPDVIGKPTMAEAAGDWFRAIVAALFGSYDATTHRRHINEVFLLVPKKNGKSSYAATMMVVAMLMNRRPNAEYLLVAPTKEIATIAFNQAKGIIECDEHLAKVFSTHEHIRTIRAREAGNRPASTLQIKAADTDAITGSKSTGILVDETHEFSRKSNASAVFVEVRGALAARPDGFMIQITTQSKKAPAGVFKAELATARDVRDGRLTLPRLAVLYELPTELAKDGGWKRPETWGLVNPNLGRSVDEKFLETSLITAERDGIDALTLLASQHFNVEIGIALRDDAWAGAPHWEAAAEPGLTLETLIERSDVVTVGCDGGGLDDLFGLSVIGRCKRTRVWLGWHHAWAHPTVLDRRKDIAETLQDFVEDGDLTICDDPTQDIREVADVVERLVDEGLVPDKYGIGVDPAGITALIDELAEREIEADVNGGPVTAVPQGYRLNGAVLGTERKLADGTFRHAGSRMMAWCVGNAKAEQRGNAILITKQVSGKAKIDPLIATFNAATLMSRNPEAGGAVVIPDDYRVVA